MATSAANLVLLKEDVPVSVFFLSSDRPTTLGRSPDSDIILSDLSCSRLHAVVQKRGEEWILCDRSSRNGTAVNDRLVEKEISLYSGDRIQLAHSHLLFCQTEDPPQPNHPTKEPTDSLELSRSLSETLAVAIGHLTNQKELTSHLNRARDENRTLRVLLGQESEIVGDSPEMKGVLALVKRVAESSATVLIRGESGVGKELVARSIHFAGPRREKPLVCLNCAALSESLLESELFGHEKGAFTGATDRKIGKFEAADGGTLFLDEIAEMNPGLQAKFLRVLEGQPFERVGGNKPIKVDVRVIAATNRDLEKEVADGRFRHDLFFRLHVLEIPVPPLRKRSADILSLAEFFRERFSLQMKRKFLRFSQEAAERLRFYRWPGNVRELKNVIERAVLLGTPPAIEADDLLLSTLRTTGNTAPIQRPDTVAAGETFGMREPASDRPVPRENGTFSKFSDSVFVPQTIEEMERNLIERTLDFFDWNKSKSARALGIERTTLDRKIVRYKIRRRQ